MIIASIHVAADGSNETADKFKSTGNGASVFAIAQTALRQTVHAKYMTALPNKPYPKNAPSGISRLISAALILGITPPKKPPAALIAELAKCAIIPPGRNVIAKADNKTLSPAMIIHAFALEAVAILIEFVGSGDKNAFIVLIVSVIIGLGCAGGAYCC